MISSRDRAPSCGTVRAAAVAQLLESLKAYSSIQQHPATSSNQQYLELVETAPMGAHSVMHDIDYLVWEPVELARVKPRNEDSDQTPVVDGSTHDAGLEHRVFTHNGTVRIRAPIGRYNDTVLDIHVLSPCTRRDVLEAIHALYMRPATLDHANILRRKRGTACSESHIKGVESTLASGGDAKMVDFNGSMTYGVAAGSGGSLVQQHTPARDSVGLRARRSCVGNVRFEGLRGDDASHTYDLLLGS